MRKSVGIVAMAGMVAAMPAAAQEQPVVTVAIGESVSLSLDGKPRVTERQQGRAPSPFEAHVIAMAAAAMFPNAMGPNSADLQSDGIPPEPIAPNKLVVRFFPVGNGKGSLLALTNGYDKVVAYRARITVKGKSDATDVCTLLPAKRSYEHWPYAIEKIELTGFAFESWDGGRPRCE